MEDIDNKVDGLFNKIVCLFVKKQLSGVCLVGSILLHEALKKRGISSKLQEGFFISNDMYYGYHVWLIVNNKNYDIGLAVLEILQGNILKTNGVVTRTIIDEPKELERIDLDNKQEISEYLNMKRMYSIYLKNPKKYWKFMDKKYLRNWETLKL